MLCVCVCVARLWFCTICQSAFAMNVGQQCANSLRFLYARSSRKLQRGVAVSVQQQPQHVHVVLEMRFAAGSLHGSGRPFYAVGKTFCRSSHSFTSSPKRHKSPAFEQAALPGAAPGGSGRPCSSSAQSRPRSPPAQPPPRSTRPPQPQNCPSTGTHRRCPGRPYRRRCSSLRSRALGRSTCQLPCRRLEVGTRRTCPTTL